MLWKVLYMLEKIWCQQNHDFTCRTNYCKAKFCRFDTILWVLNAAWKHSLLFFFVHWAYPDWSYSRLNASCSKVLSLYCLNAVFCIEGAGPGLSLRGLNLWWILMDLWLLLFEELRLSEAGKPLKRKQLMKWGAQ